MASLAADIRDWASDSARSLLKLLKLLAAAAIGVLGSRVLTEWFAPREAALVVLLICSALLGAKAAVEVARGYKRA